MGKDFFIGGMQFFRLLNGGGIMIIMLTRQKGKEIDVAKKEDHH